MLNPLLCEPPMLPINSVVAIPCAKLYLKVLLCGSSLSILYALLDVPMISACITVSHWLPIKLVIVLVNVGRLVKLTSEVCINACEPLNEPLRFQRSLMIDANKRNTPRVRWKRESLPHFKRNISISSGWNGYALRILLM